jgi:hypothetical protein
LEFSLQAAVLKGKLSLNFELQTARQVAALKEVIE